MADITGTGSITQLEKGKTRGKCRKWQLRVNMGLDPKTGKYKVRTRRFSGTYTEAKNALRAFTEEIEENKVSGRTTYTVKQWCDRYIERRQLNKEIAPSTAKRIQSNCKAACRHIGYANIAKVTPTMLDDMYIAMLKGDTLSGRPSSGTHVHHIHNTLVLVFNQAVREGVLVSNPCDKANPPRNDCKEKHAIEPEKVREFVGMLDPGEDSCCAYILALCMGMRRGEVCGLSWGDVDFERMTIYVHHSVDVFSNLRTTKTKSGTRLLPMSKFVAAALHVLHEFQEKRVAQLNHDRKKHGNAHGEQIELTNESPVIMNISGRRLNPTTLSKWWEDDRKLYGLDGVTFHELRHTYLSMLALNGVHPKVMQELAGHSDPQTTMQIYTHVNLDAKRSAADVFDHALTA